MLRLTAVSMLLVCVMAGVAVQAGEVPLKDIVPEYMGDGLETAIVPSPKQADLKDVCVELAQPPVCVVPAEMVEAWKKLKESGLAQRKMAQAQKPSWPNLAPFVLEIEDLFPGAEFVSEMPANADRPVFVLVADNGFDQPKAALGDALPALPKVDDEICALERYALVSGAPNGQPRMISYGSTGWGALWGVQTLRQMIFEKDGKRYVRQGTIQDWPTLWFRGGKRCQDWWVRYKGNSGFDNYPFDFALHRLLRFHNGLVKAKPMYMKEYKGSLAAAIEEGADCFMIDFNDGEFKTLENKPDAKEEEPFPGDPAKTVKYIIEELRKEARARNSGIRIGYMGAAYSWNANAPREGEMLRKENALADADFVAMNGLEVFTDQFHHKVAEAYREDFGLKCKLLMYDCQSCVRPMRTLNYKDSEVWKHLCGVTAQSASPIFFIGLADYCWSPEAYDPDRAMKLALREFSDRNPEFYKALTEYVSFFNANDYVPDYMAREELIALFKKNTDGMLARLDPLKPFLEAGKMARLVRLENGGDGLAGIAPPARGRKKEEPLVEKYGFKVYQVKRVEGITIDGKLDEDAWKRAPLMDTFVPAANIKGHSKEPLPDGPRAVIVRALYDDTGLYLSAEFKGADAATMQLVREKLEEAGPKPPEYRGGSHRLGPTFEIFMKPDMKSILRWQILHTVPNLYSGNRYSYFDPEDPEASTHGWDPKADFRFAVASDDSYIFEGKFPFWDRIGKPKKGDVWGVQIQLNKILSPENAIVEVEEKGAKKKKPQPQPYWLYWWTYSHFNNSNMWAFEYDYGRWLFE